MAVCPAGDEVIGLYNADRRAYVTDVLRPLQHKAEPVYVRSGSEAERVARKRATKDVRYVDFQVGLGTVDNFITGLQHMFDSAKAGGTAVRLHLRFTGDALGEVTVEVANGELSVVSGLTGDPDTIVTAESRRWIVLLERTLAGGGLDTDGFEVVGDAAGLTQLLQCLR